VICQMLGCAKLSPQGEVTVPAALADIPTCALAMTRRAATTGHPIVVALRNTRKQPPQHGTHRQFVFAVENRFDDSFNLAPVRIPQKFLSERNSVNPNF
jgi:hypothetical protein